jgi:drug/metabolite transporter (DMT)-like permease
MAFRANHGQGMALVIAAGAVWSLNGLMIRLVGEAGTWQVLFYRSIGMVPVLLVLISLAGGARVLTAMASTGRAGIIGGLGLALAFSGAIYSMQHTTIANAVFLFAAAPLITAALSMPVLGERVQPVTWLAILIAAAGIFLMVREGLSAGAGPGNAAALASAAGFSIFTLALRSGHLSDMTPAILIGALFAIAAAAVAVALRAESFALPVRGWGLSLLMGAALICGGMILFNAGVRAIPASEAQLLSLIEVMLAPVWVWLLLGEETSRDTLIGGAVLLSGIAVHTVLARPR